ncbi:lytic transglycosylase [Methylovulum psychrotolerans]|uniref:Lytic transglycosylase n=1 Tax=Methylovulum psychrotolerans TaxID=1704499 RepID=A0A1Z4BV26_9GAMM|nr:LysM peptidoglycan-binding domain-containing protein [Methylovulum psychrotolerans]ASF45167.1 lytic transglycosylase [Methylovulum psychrotolerans]POZ50504.1 lytic transglycosylase [Methylovulum psychrotolerans]
MHVNFKRPVNFLLILLSFLAAGCTENATDQISATDQVSGNTDPNAPENVSGQAGSRLKFNKHKPQSETAQYDSVWDRLLALYSLPEMDNERIDRAVDWYLQHPASLAIIQQRAEPYLHHILDEVEAKHIPGELALLPVVESAFVVNAYSTADASGLWQFIPSTGQEYGLEQNDWYDGRRDVYASTKAATTYLKELSELFDGDWLLALASYNCGKNRVRKSIDKNEGRSLPTDYWSLSLPQETQDYVPRLLAIAKIFANAERYNLHLHHIPNKPYFEAVDIKAPLDLRKAAQLANTPFDQFLKLNPGFNRSCTAPQGPHRLLVPVAQAQNFKRNLAQLPFNERVDYSQFYEEAAPAPAPARIRSEERLAAAPIMKRSEPKEERHEEIQTSTISGRYTVKPGETLSAIAERSHTSIAALRQANHLPDGNVRWGMRLQIPSASDDLNDARAERQPIAVKAAKIQTGGSGQMYAVKKGDTFWNISQRFAVDPKDLAEWNKITLKTALLPGRKLVIKGGTANQQVASAAPIRLVHYKVGNGDTLTQIAKRFNISVSELRKTNADALSRGLRPGQQLKVIVDGQPST